MGDESGIGEEIIMRAMLPQMRLNFPLSRAFFWNAFDVLNATQAADNAVYPVTCAGMAPALPAYGIR